MSSILQSDSKFLAAGVGMVMESVVSGFKVEGEQVQVEEGVVDSAVRKDSMVTEVGKVKQHRVAKKLR